MWLIIVIVVIGIIGMVMEGIIGALSEGMELSFGILSELIKNSLTNKVIMTIIVIAIAIQIINSFIWASEALVIVIKLCAVAVIVLIAVQIIRLIFSSKNNE